MRTEIYRLTFVSLFFQEHFKYRGRRGVTRIRGVGRVQGATIVGFGQQVKSSIDFTTEHKICKFATDGIAGVLKLYFTL